MDNTIDLAYQPRKRYVTRHQRQQAKEELVRYLAAGLNITTACRLAMVSRKTFYNWYQRDEQFCQNVERALGIAIGRAEAVVQKAIQDGDVNTARWFLERRCPEYRISTHREGDSDDDYELVLLTLDGERVKL